MMQHPPSDDTEATLAAIAYVPGVAPLVWLTLETGRPQQFLRYHVAHAMMLTGATLGAIVLVALLGFVSSAPAAMYLVLGLGISGIILAGTLLHGLAALQAYRKRLVVLPLLTPLYYRLFKPT